MRRVGIGWLAIGLIACAGTAPESPRAPGIPPQETLDEVYLEYENLLGPKALAIAFDGRSWAYGFTHSASTPADARERALALCARWQIRNGVTTECGIYAVDDEIVWSIHDELAGFRSYPGHKALWVSGDATSYLFDARFGFESTEAAAQAAMEDCRIYSSEWGYDATCRICQLDDGVPCTDLEEGWQAEIFAR